MVCGARELSGGCHREFLMPTRMYHKMTLLSRSLGHLSAVYCVAFDRTGEYIFTVSIVAALWILPVCCLLRHDNCNLT